MMRAAGLHFFPPILCKSLKRGVYLENEGQSKRVVATYVIFNKCYFSHCRLIEIHFFCFLRQRLGKKNSVVMQLSHHSSASMYPKQVVLVQS